MDASKSSPEEDTLGQIFMSWIKDSHENPTRENYLRLQEVMDKGCTEKQFIMRSQRLGVNSAITIARMLDRTPIERIDLYENVIRDHGVQAVSQLLRDSRTLTYLNLGSNDIGPLGCAYISALIPLNKKLKYLILGSEDGDMNLNKINGEAALALAEALGKNKSVKFLDLNGNPLGADSQDVFVAFAKVLEKSKTLSTIKLGATLMNTLSAICLAKSLKDNEQIEYLDFHENDLGPAAGEALAECMGHRALKEGNTLHTLLLQNNPKLRAKGLVPLFRALKQDTALVTLNLARTFIEDDGTLVLAETLQMNQTLTHLDLTDNEITEEGAIALFGALQANGSVRFLGLSNNRVKDNGACALATTLEVNQSLTNLELSTTRISDRGAVALGVALALNTTLTSLKINNNHISDAAGCAFAELIDRNSKLLVIDVKGNQVSHSTLLQIKKVVKKNKALRDGDGPNQLQGEVIRLHFQQYKLQEANAQLKEHQKARLELQEQADRTEREAMTENENTAKRSKEIIEKILLVENYCQELKVKAKLRDEELGKGTSQFDADLAALQEKLKYDSAAREEKQKEAEDTDNRLKEMETGRTKRLKDLQNQLVQAGADKLAWVDKNKIYREAAKEAQEKITDLEGQIQAKQAAMIAERESKIANKEKKKKKGDANDLIDSLLGA